MLLLFLNDSKQLFLSAWDYSNSNIKINQTLLVNQNYILSSWLQSSIKDHFLLQFIQYVISAEE